MNISNAGSVVTQVITSSTLRRTLPRKILCSDIFIDNRFRPSTQEPCHHFVLAGNRKEKPVSERIGIQEIENLKNRRLIQVSIIRDLLSRIQHQEHAPIA
jgi:hypothetical protein